MRVIDARTGKSFEVSSSKVTTFDPGKGPVFDYGDHWLEIDTVIPGLFSARFGGMSYWRENGQLRGEGVGGPLMVRWTHPSHFLQHVAFIPS